MPNIKAIVGNPPYNYQSGGTMVSCYHKYMFASFNLTSKYTSFIIPSSWLKNIGQGKAPSKFFEMTNWQVINHEPCSKRIFPEVHTVPGVNYFLWDKDHDGNCKFNGVDRNLNVFEDLFIYDATEESICKYISDQVGDDTLRNRVNMKPIRYYGVVKNGKHIVHKCGDKTFSTNGIKEVVPNSLSKWKVGTTGAGEYANYPYEGVPYNITGRIHICGPNEIFCNSTIITLGVYDTEEEVTNFYKFLKTKFVRFLVHVTNGNFMKSPTNYKLVPHIEDFTRTYSDTDLYSMFNLTKDMIDHIETASYLQKEYN